MSDTKLHINLGKTYNGTDISAGDVSNAKDFLHGAFNAETQKKEILEQ